MFPFICSSPVSHSYYYCQSFLFSDSLVKYVLWTSHSSNPYSFIFITTKPSLFLPTIIFFFFVSYSHSSWHSYLIFSPLVQSFYLLLLLLSLSFPIHSLPSTSLFLTRPFPSPLPLPLLSPPFLSSDLLCFGDATDSRGQKPIREEVPRSHHFCYQWQASTDYNQIRWSFKSKSHILLDIIFISSTHCITSQLWRNVITVLIEIEY